MIGQHSIRVMILFALKVSKYVGDGKRSLCLFSSFDSIRLVDILTWPWQLESVSNSKTKQCTTSEGKK